MVVFFAGLQLISLQQLGQSQAEPESLQSHRKRECLDAMPIDSKSNASALAARYLGEEPHVLVPSVASVIIGPILGIALGRHILKLNLIPSPVSAGMK